MRMHSLLGPLTFLEYRNLLTGFRNYTFFLFLFNVHKTRVEELSCFSLPPGHELASLLTCYKGSWVRYPEKI